MTTIKRRGTGQTGFEPDKEQVAQGKAFNENLRYLQGFKQAVGAGSTVPLQISLNAPGRALLGMAIYPTVATQDISDCTATVLVNNNNVVNNAGLQSFNPTFVGSMMFLPIPQPLFGNDTITVNLTNNSGVTVTVACNVFYVPR